MPIRGWERERERERERFIRNSLLGFDAKGVRSKVVWGGEIPDIGVGKTEWGWIRVRLE